MKAGQADPAEEQESLEAQWFSYSTKVKPGSRQGTGGRKPFQEPSWTISKKVRDHLRALKFGTFERSDEQKEARLRDALIKHASDAQLSVTRSCFCRRVPFGLLKDAPTIARLTSLGLSFPSNGYVICSQDEAHGQLHEIARRSDDCFLFGQNTPVDIAQLMAAIPHIHAAVLSENRIGPNGAKLIFSSLRSEYPISLLALTENSIGDIGCEEIQNALSVHSKLKWLCLAMNEISDVGARYIAAGVSECHCQEVMSKVISEDQVEVFRLLMMHGYPITSHTRNRDGLIFTAVCAGAIGITECMLDQGSDVDSKDSKGSSILSRAACLGHVNVLKLLISRGADASCRDNEGRTALIEAAENGHTEAVEIIIKALAFLERNLHIVIHSLECLPENVAPHEKTAAAPHWFSLDALQGSVHSVKHAATKHRNSWVPESGVEGFLKGASSLTSFITSKSRRQSEVSDSKDTSSVQLNGRFSQESFVCLQYDDETFTWPVSAPSVNEEMVKIDGKVSFKSIKSPTDWINVNFFEADVAIENGQRLLGRGRIPLSCFSRQHGKSSTAWCDIFDEGGTALVCIKFSVHMDCEHLNQRTKLGRNALMLAARNGMQNIINVLCVNGANVDGTDADGNTPLLLASRLGHTEVVKSLLFHRANFEITNRAGISALMAAQQQGHSTIVHILLGHDMAARRTPISVKRWQPLPSTTIEMNAEPFAGGYERCCLTLVILEARNLPVADVSGLSDPFCVVTLNHQEKKTRVIQRTLNPKWNQEIHFDDQMLTVWENQTLFLEVFDSNLTSSAVLLGKKNVEVSRLLSMQREGVEGDWTFASFQLLDERGNLVHGQHDKDLRNQGVTQTSDISIKFKLTKGSGRFLTIGIIEPRNLPKPKSKFTEPYCVVKYGDQSIQTHSLNRINGTSWDFFINFNASHLDGSLEIEIYDKSSARLSSSSQDDLLIGCLEIPTDIISSFISVNLCNFDLELFDAGGNTLKGTGGHVSSLHLTFQILVRLSENLLQKMHGTSREQMVSSALKTFPKKRLSSTSRQCLNEILDSSWVSEKLGMDRQGSGQHSLRYVDSGDAGENVVLPLSIEPQLKDEQQSKTFEPISNVSKSEEIIINKHIRAELGQRVMMCESVKSMHPEFLAQTGFGPGIIIRVGSAFNSSLKSLPLSSPTTDENSCLVWWDLTGQKIDHCIGLNGNYHLSLFQEESDIAVPELLSLRSHHAISSLLTLNLDNNSISDKGATYLAHAVQSNEVLQNLSLSGNKIGPDGAEALGKCLCRNSSLTYLNFSRNRMKDEGLRELCRALESNKGIKVKSFSIGENCIGPIGMRFLAKMMIRNTTLQILDVKNNLIGGDGAMLLSQGLRRNKAILDLDVSYNVLGDAGVSSIIRALRKMPETFGRRELSVNNTLCRLDLSRNNLTDRCVSLIIDSLQHNRALHSVSLEGNEISADSMQTLTQCILGNLESAKMEQSVLKIQKAFRSARHQRRKHAEARRNIESNLLDGAVMARVGDGRGPVGIRTLQPAPITDADYSTECLEEQTDEANLIQDPLSQQNAQDGEENKDLVRELSGQNLLLTATKVTMYNMADAVILEHAAAYALAQEAASRLSKAGQNYSQLEERFYELMTNEAAEQLDIVDAVERLNHAREEILQALEESRLAEEAGNRCFQAAQTFAQYEKDEAQIVDTVQQIQDQLTGEVSTADLLEAKPSAADDNAGMANAVLSDPRLHSTESKPSPNEFFGASKEEFTDSDEVLIESAVREFSTESGQSLTTEEIDLLLNEFSNLQEVSLHVGKEIETCAAITAVEVDACIREIADLKNLVSVQAQERKELTELYDAALSSSFTSQVRQSDGILEL